MIRPYDWQLRVIQLLAAAGMLVAFYLLLFHNGVLVGVCPPSGWEDCGRVSGPGAQYASVGPIPVALIGLVGYIVIFLVVWLKDWWDWLEINVGPLMLSLAGISFLFSLGLTALEVFVLQAICRYCVVSAVIVTVMLVLAIGYQKAEMRAANEP
jgi:uncharacterized membrane protein